MLVHSLCLISMVAVSPDVPLGGNVWLSGDTASPGLVAELKAGLETLPPRMRDIPNGPLRIELRTDSSEWGMGDGTALHPEWSPATFVLYKYKEPADRRALARLERLSPTDRERLWRRRAVVHAVVERWNEHLRWSARPSWRDINGWLTPLERPLTTREQAVNSYSWAFSRELGRGSAAHDLVTFAEEALVPAESIDADAVPVDDQVRCQERLKSRFLSGLLTAMGGRALEPGQCPAFDGWAKLDQLTRIEVWFTAPSGNHAESIFGHLLLRPVYRDDALARGGIDERAIEIAAMVGVGEDLKTHLSKGLTGGYRAIFATTPVRHVLREATEVEQRTVRRWCLRLSSDERARVMDRLWELERRGYPDYFFFTDNCAAYLVWALNPALEPARRIDRPGTFWVMPTATLDALAQDGDGLVVEEDSPIPSDRDLAQRAQTLRSSVARKLLRTPLGDAWQRELASLDSSDRQRRARAEQTLAELVRRTLRADPSLEPDLAALVASVNASERYLADRAENELEALDHATAWVPPGMHLATSDEMVTERQHEYEREDAEARARHELERTLAVANTVSELPHRLPTADEKARSESARAERTTFLDWTSVEGDLVEELHGGLPAVSAQPTRGLRSSGAGYVSFGIGSFGDAPLLRIDSAVVRERVGDQRERGFSSSTEVRLFDTVTTWLLSPSGPRLDSLSLTAIGLRFLGDEPSVAHRSWADAFGAGGQISMRMRGPTNEQRAWVDAQLYWLPVATADRRAFIALGLGPETDVLAVWLPRAWTVGPRAELVARAPLPFHAANAIQLEASATPQLTLAGRTGEVQTWLAASLWIDWRLAPLGARDAVMALGVDADARLSSALVEQRWLASARLQWM